MAENDEKTEDLGMRAMLEKAFDDDAAENGDDEEAVAAPAKSEEKSAPAEGGEGEDEGEGNREKAAAGEGDDKPKSSYRQPPSRWSKEDKEAWAKAFGALDTENPTHKQIGALRDMMYQRWGEMEQASAEAEKARKEIETRYDVLEKVIGPRRAAIQAAGETPEKAIADLFAISDFASQRPDEFIKNFARQRGIDLAQLAGVKAGAAEPGASTPDDDDPLGVIPQHYKEAVKLVPQLQQQIQQLSNGMNQFQQTWQQRQAQEADSQNRQVADYITNWSQERDAAGNVLRPHYEAVKGHMQLYLERGMAQNLDEAYSMASRAHPEVSRMIRESEEAQRVAENERAAAEVAARKKAAAVSAGGRPAYTPVGGTGGVQGDSIRDLLTSAWEAAESTGARV